MFFDPKLDKSHEILWDVICSLQAEDIRPGVNLIYINYDTTANALDIFEQDHDNDFVKLYKNCVIKQL